MALKTVSVDSGTEEQIHARRAEMERHWPALADPLDILIRYEERAFVVFNLCEYDDPVVDRNFINSYINTRLGDRNHVVQRIHRNERATARHARNTGTSSSTAGNWNTIGAQCPQWRNGARLVGRPEVLLAPERVREWVPLSTAGVIRK